MRGATILWACLAIIAGSALFMLKYEVQAQDDRLRGLEREIVRTRASIHVLKAEWSHLNDPMLLKMLAERHLGMTPQPVSRVEIIASLPMAETGSKAPVENEPKPVSPQPPPAAFMAAAKPVAPASPAASVVQANHQPQAAAPVARSPIAPAASVPATPPARVAAAQPVRAAAPERPQPVAAPIAQSNVRPIESRPAATDAQPTRRGNVVVITSPAALDRSGVIPVRTSP